MADEIKGLIGPNGEHKEGDGLIGVMKHHYGARKMKMAAQMFEPNIIIDRGRGRESDLDTIGAALAEVLDIAKREGYQEIVDILIQRDYVDGLTDLD